jgi:DNA-binding SARP family transcriptional activator
LPGKLPLKSEHCYNSPMAQAASIYLLGMAQIQREGQATGVILRRKSKALLAYLTVTRERHPRQALSALFCEASDDPARALRWHLSALRHQLGSDAILADAASVQINPQTIWADVWAFEQALADTAVLETADLETALSLYQGDLLAALSLPDSSEFELWLLGEQARFRSLYESALSHLVARLIAQRDYARALPWAQRLVQTAPLLEEAHVRLIWLYGQTGQRQTALAQYEQCRAILWRELAVEPTPEITAVYEAVFRHELTPLQVRPAPSPTPDRAVDYLAGRETELALIHQAWREAQSGQGSLLLIEAEAGMGKTRLAQALEPEAGWVIIGRSYESSQALPYTPWIEALETALTDERHLTDIAPFWLDQLGRLLPSLPLRRGVTTPVPAAGEVEQLFTAVFHLLQSLSQRPLLLLLDDLQWADEASLRLLHYLTRRIGRLPILLIATFRAEETADNPAMQTLISDWRREPTLRHLRLQPLDLTAVQTLTSQLWPALSTADRPGVSQILWQATGGNPLFLTELLRELAPGETLPNDLPIPPSLRDLAQRRLSQLPESGRQVVEALAVLSTPATLVQAQQTSARSEEETVAAIDLALHRRLLTAVTDTRYDFRHDLLREAVLAQMSQVRRQLLNRRAATMLAQSAVRREPDRRQEMAGRILRHAWQGHDYAQVLAWAEAAAAYARRLFAYGEALAVWETAVAALNQLQRAGDISPNAADDQRLHLLLNQVEMLSLLGRWLEEAPLFAEIAGLLARHPAAELEGRFYLRRGICHFNQGQNEPAWADIQRALTLFALSPDSAHTAQALYIAGRIKIGLGQNPTGHTLLTQALALYQANSDLSGEALCLSSLAILMLELGQVAIPLAELLPRALAIAEAQQDLVAQARAAFVTAVAWNTVYYPPQMRLFAEKARQLGQTLQDETMVNRANYLLANATIIEGDIPQGLALWRRVHQAAQAQGDRWLAGWAIHIFGRLALGSGDVAAAEQWLTASLALRQEMGEAQNQINDRAWMGRLRLAQKQPALALIHTTDAVTQLEAQRKQLYVLDTCDIFMAHAEALAANGRLAEAHTALARAYQEMMHIADQIALAAARDSYFRYLHMARIRQAWQQGEIRPYPH